MSPKPYAVLFTRRARRDLDRLERQAVSRLAPQIDALALEPRPVGCVKVQSEAGVWRIRVGDWRVGYRVDDAAREVTVIRVGHRREFYD